MKTMPLVVAGIAATLMLGACNPEVADAEPDLDLTAEQLIDRWIEAAGGMEAYWSREDSRYTLTTELYEGDTGRLKRTRPRYVTIARIDTGDAVRIERWEGNDFIVQGFDGIDTWATMNGEPLGPGDKDYDQVVYVSRDVVYWLSLPFKLKDPGVFLHDEGLDENGLRVVRVEFGEGVGDHDDTWFYRFDEGRTVPVQIAYKEANSTNVNRLRWEDIQDVGGVIFGGRRVHFNEQGIVDKVLATSDFVLTPGIDPRFFRTAN